MSKKSFLLGAIASVITINSVFADATITTKNYVDTTRQATIPAAETNIETPGVSVVTYTDTAGTIGERWIWEAPFLPENDTDLVAVSALQGDANTVVVRDRVGFPLGSRGIYDGSTTYDSSTDADKLVTASVVQNATNPLPKKTVTHRICTSWIDGRPHTDANCLLWDLADETVYSAQCYTPADCGSSGLCTCINHMCNCAVN